MPKHKIIINQSKHFRFVSFYYRFKLTIIRDIELLDSLKVGENVKKLYKIAGFMFNFDQDKLLDKHPKIKKEFLKHKKYESVDFNYIIQQKYQE